MPAQESALTTRYAQVLEAVIAAIEPLDAASLRLPCAAERCSVAALAGHIAAVHGAAAGFCPGHRGRRAVAAPHDGGYRPDQRRERGAQ